ncbi:MAG: TIGR03667 family PPOX class F420-dependent oxidoreductase [Solirubrobacteraceae bacterium]
MIIDESTDSGARAAERLRDEIVIWLTTISPKSGPLPMPVWFLWDRADRVLMFSQDGARVRNLQAEPRVSLNFDGDGRGGNIVVLSGVANVDPQAGPADRIDAYLEKYAGHIKRIGLTPEQFGAKYSNPIRIELTKLRR